jgi:hypothetical protein
LVLFVEKAKLPGKTHRRQPEKSNEDIGIGLGQTLRGWF